MSPQEEIQARLVAVESEADRLLTRIDAGRRVTTEEATTLRRDVGRLPRGSGAIPSWRLAAVDAALRDVVAGSELPLPQPRRSREDTPARLRPPQRRREHRRVHALRGRIERYEEHCSRGGVMFSCDVVTLEVDVRVLRAARGMTGHDIQQVDDLARRVTRLAQLAERNRTRLGRRGRRRSSEGTGFWRYSTIGAASLEAGEMLRHPRTSNKGRPARSAWSCGGGGLPTLGKR